MENELKEKLTTKLSDKEFSLDQIKIVLSLLDQARIKNLEDLKQQIDAKITKIKNEQTD